MTARTYVREGTGGTDKAVVEPLPKDGRVHVTTHYAGHQTSRLRRVPSDNPADLAIDIGDDLLEDGYTLTLRDRS
jgi:hypothetical protein